MYFVKTPWLLKQIFPELIWSIDTSEKKIYLTFDDGPHPTITPFVLEVLKKYNAKVTFFCVGKNVEAYFDVYKKIIDDGHRIANHTQSHLNGWKKDTETFVDNVISAREYINSNLFRPPYGKLKRNQALSIIEKGYHIIMWDVLSGDFDKNISKEKCLQNVISKTQQGSIVVFHDSEKAFEKLSYCLPRVLEHFTQLGFTFKELPNFN